MDIIIIGAGIGGLTTAIACEQAGFNTMVYEASSSHSVAGAGIWMACNAMQVFDRLGIAHDILNAGVALDRLSITDHHLNVIQDTEQAPYIERFGYSITSIHRSRLRDVLLKHYPKEVHLGKRLTKLEEKGNQVIAHFEDGSTQAGDMLLGTDGIHSAVRQQLFPSSRIRYSGQTCWRGVADMTLPTELGNCCIEAWGNKYRLGLSVISPSEVYWFAVAKAPQGQQDEPSMRKAMLRDMYADFAQPVPNLLEATPEDRIIRHDLSDLQPLSQWHRGRICLIGDAAHATTPNMGQGGGQAVEDAWFIAQALSQHRDPSLAFQHFQTMRSKKVNHIVKTSWRIGKAAHIPFGQGLRNRLMRLTPPARIEKMLIDLYQIDAV